MNSAIKTLEEIGQNTSLKQHDSLLEMLKSLDVKNSSIDNISSIEKEFVCVLIPEDDEESDDKDGNA